MTKAKKMAARTTESYLPSLCLFEALLAEEIEDVAASSFKCHHENLPDSEWILKAEPYDVAFSINCGVACGLVHHLFGGFDLLDWQYDSLTEQFAEALADAPLYTEIAARKIEEWQAANQLDEAKAAVK